MDTRLFWKQRVQAALGQASVVVLLNFVTANMEGVNVSAWQIGKGGKHPPAACQKRVALSFWSGLNRVFKIVK